jgi:hypothetical protein
MADANVTALRPAAPSPTSGGGPSRNALRQRRHRSNGAVVAAFGG